MRTTTWAIIALLACALCACQKQAASTGIEAKSLDFYHQNADIAQAVSEKCLEFERKEISMLPGNQQREWQDSLDGVNCQNAKTARSYQIIAERREQLRKSNAALRESKP